MATRHRNGDNALMDDLTKFMQSLQNAFDSDDLTAVYPFFSLPLIVYSLAGVTVLRTEDELLHIAKDYRSTLKAHGMVSTTIAVVEQDAKVNRRQRVTVSYRNLTADGEFVASTLIRYFLHQRDGALVIEMLEYIEAPLPPEDVVRIAH